MSYTQRIIASAAFGLLASPALALTVNPTFTDLGEVFPVHPTEGSTVYRADLTGLGLTEIAAITLTDSNSGLGGSPNAYSGFDLDAFVLSTDDDYTNTGAYITATSFSFTAGSLRPDPTNDPLFVSNTTGALNGSTAGGDVDEVFATLNAVDAFHFGAGSITLGDGGSIVANFNPKISVGASLYLFVAEVGTGAGESAVGAIEVSDNPPAVPLPASGLFLLAGIGALAAARRKKS